MKKEICLILSLLMIAVSLPAQIYLGQPKSISQDKANGNRTPRVALFDDGTPIIYWGKSGNEPKMYVSTFRDTGFSYPISVPTGAITPSIWGGALGPEIAVFGNSIFIAFESYGEGIFIVRSNDRGNTFSDPVSVVDLPSDRVATLPDISLDAFGNPIISFVTTDHQEQNALYEITFSKDGGLSFEPSVVANTAASGGAVCECCPASVLSAKDSLMLLAFRNNDSNIRDIWVAKSNDYGQTFSEAIDVDDTDWEIFGCPSNGPSSAVLGDTLFTTFFSQGEGRSRVYLSTLHLQDTVAAEQLKLPSFFGNDAAQNYPRLTGKNDTLGIVWQERQGFGDDIILGYTKTGSTGLEYVQISDGQLSETNADIAFSNSVFHIVYSDQREGTVIYRPVSFSPFSKTTDNNSTAELTISPNPVTEDAYIDLGDFFRGNPVKALLFSSNGTLLKSMVMNDQRNLFKRGDLPGGLYFLKIKNQSQNTFFKLILQ